MRVGLEIMRALEVRPKEIRATGGGASVDLWLRLQADVYGLPVHRLRIEEGAAYGAALLGHVAAGTFASVDEAAAVVRTMPEMTEPDPRAIETYDALYDVYRSSYRAMREGMHRLSSLAGS
jgi:xylulokinase